MAKDEADADAKKPKHAHPRDSKRPKKVFVSNDANTSAAAKEFSEFRQRLKPSRNTRWAQDSDGDDIPVTRRSKKGKKDGDSDEAAGTGSKISLKYVLLMLLMLAPGFIEMVAMSGGLYSSAFAAADWLWNPRHAAIVVLCVTVPVLLYKLLSGRVVTALFVTVMVCSVVVPTFSVARCSPVMINYTHFSTNYSIQRKAAEIMQDAVMPCVRRYPMAVYRLSVMSPQLSLVMHPRDIINVNITSSQDSPLPYRLLMAKSGRSVRGRWHLIFLLAKVSRRLSMRDVYTSMQEDDRDDASYILRGKLVDTPKSMQPMQQQLARDKLMRPMMFDVHSIEPFT
eukprot:scpid59464/ scgid26173/ 